MMPTFDSQNSQCLLRVYREGIAAAVGHDLVLRCEAFQVEADLDAQPIQIQARFQADSLRVVGTPDEFEATGGARASVALKKRDRQKIERNLRRDVLQTERYPVIIFESTSVFAAPDAPDGEALRVHGRLELHGVERDISVRVARDADRAIGRVRLHQPDFGIAPFRALMGALKIKADVDVELQVGWVFGEAGQAG